MPFDKIEYAKGRQVVVRAYGVKKTYQRGAETVHALRGIDLEIFRGEYICVMGPSGSGKSTFFNMVGGLDTPTGGRVFMDEVDMAQLNAHELAFLLDRFADRFTIGHLRCADVGFNAKFAEHAIAQDLEVQLAHTHDDGLSRFLVRLNAESRVLFRKGTKRKRKLFAVGLRFGFDGHRDHWIGEVHLLQQKRGIL